MLAGFSDMRYGKRLQRLAVARARKLYRMAQPEAAQTLIAGMRGQLPGSDARVMADCAKTIAAKGGNSDATILQLESRKDAPPLRLAIGLGEIEDAVREATAGEGDDDDAGGA